MGEVVVAALYRFVTLEDYHELREPLLDRCLDLGIKGTLLLASEGINGTVAGSRESIDALLAHLRADPRLAALEHKESYDEDMPFYRMKVKLKREIVTMGVQGIDPNRVVGTYVDPQQWNALIDDPDVLLIDTRTDYECAFMLQEGFEEVYHLRGGILKYLEEVPQHDSAWEGECFVFDNRVAVNHALEKGHYDQCHGCRRPITEEDKRSTQYLKGVCCPYCHDSLSADQRARFAERQKQIELAEQRGEAHVGAPPPARQAATEGRD